MALGGFSKPVTFCHHQEKQKGKNGLGQYCFVCNCRLDLKYIPWDYFAIVVRFPLQALKMMEGTIHQGVPPWPFILHGNYESIAASEMTPCVDRKPPFEETGPSKLKTLLVFFPLFFIFMVQLRKRKVGSLLYSMPENTYIDFLEETFGR